MSKLFSRLHVPTVNTLTEREQEILTLIAEGRTNQEIADTLHLALSTVKWYARQIFDKLEVDNRREAVNRAETLGILGSDQAKPIPNNLPIPATAFVDREEEMSEILRLLSTSRSLTLFGPGGSGKTRLAIEAASLLVKAKSDAFQNGIWYTSLAKFQSFDPVIQAIANVTGYSFFDKDRESVQQLVDFLRNRRLLLVLDNFEHLISPESSQLLSDFLTQAPDVKLLVTSRSRLNVQGEQIFPVSGMQTPQNEFHSVEVLYEFNAIRLFVQCACRTQPKFELTGENSDSIIRICQLVEGMPLGIEMAATWMGMLSPSEIVIEIEKSFDILHAQEIDERHESIRAVFDASWKLLSTDEQTALMKMTIFRGSFSKDAAKEVANASLESLHALVNKSWLSSDYKGRFHIHELLRQYAYERLTIDQSAWKIAGNAYAQYYAALLQNLGEQMKGSHQAEALDIAELDFENFRAAWQWLTEQEEISTLVECMLFPFTIFCASRFRAKEFRKLLHKTQNFLGNRLTGKGSDIYKAAMVLADLGFYNDLYILRGNWLVELTDWHHGLPDNEIAFCWRVLLQKTPKDINGYWLVISAVFYGWFIQPIDGFQRLLELKNKFTEEQEIWLRGFSNQQLSLLLKHIETEINTNLEAREFMKNYNKDGYRDFSHAALSDFRFTGDRAEEGQTLFHIAFFEDMPEKAFSYLKQAQELLRTGGDTILSTYLLREMAYNNIRQGNFSAGFSYFHTEQEIYRDAGNQRLLAIALSWESIMALRFSDISHARKAREANLVIIRKDLNKDHQPRVQDPDHYIFEDLLAWSLFELGDIERVAGNFEKAKQCFDDANRMFSIENNRAGMAFYHRGAGDMALAMADFEAAWQYLKNSEEISRSINHVWLEAYALCRLSATAIKLHKDKTAQKTLINALQLAWDIGNKEIIMIALVTMAALETDRNQYELVVELCAFVVHHVATWNETRQQARDLIDHASLQLSLDKVETAKIRGKNGDLKKIVQRYLGSE